MARVRLDGVRKVYENGFVAVHGVDLEVQDGEFVVLVGPSGCGKSTTLRMIAGLESISEGTLTIGERVVNDLPPKARDIAMVFQSYALYPHMSVYDNMAFALKLRKLPKAEIDRRVRAAAETLGLTAVLDRTPREMSGGQRQRVAIGRAIVREPAVFLFDEPLSNLDAKLRVQTRREIAQLRRALGATVVYVTHDQVEAMTMGDRIVVMSDGRVQQVDTPLALYGRPRNRFVATFIGTPQMSVLDGSLARDGGDGLVFRTADGTIALPVPAALRGPLAAHEGRAVAVGMRPEAMRLAAPGAPPPAGSERLAMRLDLAEPLGNEVLVHASSGAHRVVARVAPQPTPAVGEPVALDVSVDQLHFFDAAGDAVR